MIWLLVFPLGAFAGFIAGLFGVGGGVVLVPIFLEVFGQMGLGAQSMKMAVGSSHAVIVANSLTAIRTHARYNPVDWQTVLQLSAGALCGAVLGSLGASLAPATLLRYLFAGFVVYLAFKMGEKGDPRRLTRTGPPVDSVSRFKAGAGIGAFAAFFGVGGGLIAVPYLIKRYGKPPHEAMAISSGLILFIALMGAFVFAVSGIGRAPQISFAIGYVHLGVVFVGGAGAVLGAQLGVHTARKLSPDKLLGSFSVFLMVIAVRLLTKG